MPPRARLGLAGAVTVLVLAGCAADSDTDAPNPTASASSPAPSSENDSSSGHGHKHEMREAEGAPAPSVSMQVSEDPVSGWNVRLKVKEFAFTPERAGGKPRDAEGHAHLYVDDEKVARVYGSWYHLPASAVPEGEHTLSVRLSANDHSTWGIDGKPIADSATITGEGSDGSSASSDTDNDSEGDADVTAEISVSDGSVSPEPGRLEVEKGQRVRIEVTADTADTVHLHGYDIGESVGPKKPAVLTFTADQAGVFELETHDSGLLLTQVAVE
ncbi:hypothetical protein CDO52_04910 [Nocardiopsis gilva YIM 90087]|uniref:EfeO-type cupredoxin-like domain-containing protein n=2 Tax=Nocardiopsis gilva TaxID=280236 RepID=A0A223S257_9ACTN|nr:hypothetical protein CDO52_04910 [Nocardiopsis gilva YIM 90087]